ncbi:hypothetical protein PVL29_001852 [Vitis rotundifolia]|nr:hypothetical protein PVL29_001852 [Vitis rotundifolia]
MGRKSNPDVTPLEIEKKFHKKQGKLADAEVSDNMFDGSEQGGSPSSLSGLNLVRPVPKKGIKFEGDDKLNEMKKPSQPAGKAVQNTKNTVPNVILRKPTVFNEDDVESKPFRLRMKPNLSLKMKKEAKFSDMALLRKPEKLSAYAENETKQESSDDARAIATDDTELKLQEEGTDDKINDVMLMRKPEPTIISANLDEKLEHSGDAEAKVSIGIEEGSSSGSSEYTGAANSMNNDIEESPETRDDSFSMGPELVDNSIIGLQPLEHSDIIDMGPAKVETSASEPSNSESVDPKGKLSMEAALQGKPKRLEQSVKEMSNQSQPETVLANPESYGNSVELENFLATSSLKEHEDTDWSRAEDLVKTRGREEVELISSSTRGFVVSFGSLIGFLPYRNLAAKWKFLAFESWLRRKGLDPSMYRQNLGIVGSHEVASNPSPDANPGPEIHKQLEGEISPNMNLEDLLRIYDQEKIKFLSSFVGQKINVNVVMADRKARRLIFSGRPKEKEEMVEKKRSLMAKLSIGDIVKCRIKKITYFGIFVEVEGVPALVHQTEVSWDATLDPASYFKIGQIVEAKVHQLDFSLERIFLSLKEITPDPLIEALEFVVGDNPLDGRLEAAQADTEWPDVESLIKELEQIEGIQSVSKGRFFLSPGLAPTFQVYMASMFENQYKLLARSGNKVQEVIVEASLGKEDMKSAILTCTNRV